MPALEFPLAPLTDGVVALRAWDAGDIGFVAQACQDADVSRYSPAIPFPYTEADAVAWFATLEPARLAGESIDFAVTRADSGEPLGAIGLSSISATLQLAEVGYWLARSARGHGFMTRAVRLLARWAFDELGVVRLELRADPENVASHRIAERCGFQREGLLRSNIVIRHSGRRRDTVVYALLACDWPADVASSPA